MRTANLMLRFGLMNHARFAPADGGTNVDTEEFSLADLADLDVSDIAEIRFETLPQGVYEFEVTKADLVEGVDKEGAKRFHATVETTILEVVAVLQADVNKESLIGKKITTNMYVRPGQPQDEIAKDIGRIRAFVADAGMDSTGKLGAIVSNLMGHRFRGKIVHQANPQDKSSPYAKLKLDPKKTK